MTRKSKLGELHEKIQVNDPDREKNDRKGSRQKLSNRKEEVRSTELPKVGILFIQKEPPVSPRGL